MQSSTAIAFRALVMLIVLISVPLFAIFGKNLPDIVKGLMEGRGLVLGPAPSGAANSDVVAQPRPTSGSTVQPGPFRAAGDTTLTAGSPPGASGSGPVSPSALGATSVTPPAQQTINSMAAAAPWHSPPSPARQLGPNGQLARA